MQYKTIWIPVEAIIIVIKYIQLAVFAEQKQSKNIMHLHENRRWPSFKCADLMVLYKHVYDVMSIPWTLRTIAPIS